ncbi:MAG: hypothetical protein GF399_13075 [Candidatus Coatesbacteria bacterium]|nr:hypothetical protein [Candidatus Coatesbacteria bacterium]
MSKDDFVALRDAVEKEIALSSESNAVFYIDEFNGLLQKIKAWDSKLFEDILQVEKPTANSEDAVTIDDLLRRISYYCDRIVRNWPLPKFRSYVGTGRR